MSEQLYRKKIRLENYNYSTAGAYFVTICTENREKILWDAVGADIIRLNSLPLSTVGKIVEQGILQISSHYENVTVDKYCIMPDHVHLLISIGADDRRIISAPTALCIKQCIKNRMQKYNSSRRGAYQAPKSTAPSP